MFTRLPAIEALEPCLCCISPAILCEKNSIGMRSTFHINAELPVTASLPLILRDHTVCIRLTIICSADSADSAIINGISQSGFCPVRILSINILENAVQHAVGMKKLYFNVFVLGNKAVFEIKDDGCGIEVNRLKTIFTGYYASDESPSDGKKKNAGIGLSVCATIIKAHGGTITAENSKNGGAIFRFTLDKEDILDEQQ